MKKLKNFSKKPGFFGFFWLCANSKQRTGSNKFRFCIKGSFASELDDLKSNLPVDAVQLSLHGAMATRDVPRPEAEIAKRVRELVGPDIPISGTFDLHGNEDGEFLKWANAAFVTKRFPHYDAPLQGERSANFLYRSVKNKFKSTTATRKPGVLTATVLQWTGAEPASSYDEYSFHG